MKRRMYLMFATALMVTAVLVLSPTSAQGQPTCPEGSSFSPTPGFGAGFVCTITNPLVDFLCPPGFEIQEFPAPQGVLFACVAVGEDGGDGQQGGGGGQQGDGGGGGGGQQGGGGVEITQEGEQEADAGEIDQTFDVS